MLFSPDGQRLAVGEAGPRIRLLDWASGQERKPFPAPASAEGISALAFSPDSQQLVAGYGAKDHDVHVWDLKTNTEVRLAGHSGWITALAFSPDGQTLASVSTDQTLRLWDVAQKGEGPRFQGHTDEVWAVAWSPDGNSLITGSKDGSVRYWDRAAKPAAPPYAVLPAKIPWVGLTFLPDSQSFLTVTFPDRAVVRWELRWETATVKEVERLSFLGTNHPSLALSPDGRWLALSDPLDNVQVWDLPARRLVTNLVCQGAIVPLVQFSPRGHILACALFYPDFRRVPKLYAVDGWREISLRDIEVKGLVEADLSADERTLAIGYGNGTAAWWDLATGQRQAFFDCRPAGLNRIRLAPDGRHFATVRFSGGMIIWDVTTGQGMRIGRIHRNELHYVVFSPDGRRLIVTGTSPKGVAKICDVETGRDMVTLPGKPGWFAHLGFSPDGTTLFAVSLEGMALFWHAPSWEEIEAKENQQAGAKPSEGP